MATRVVDEQFWGCELKTGSKEYTWNTPQTEDAEYKLFVNQASLGVHVKENERNVVEVTTKSDDDITISSCIVSLRCGVLESCNLTLGFTQDVTFKLVSGSGPVYLSGSLIQGVADVSFDEEDDDELFVDSGMDEITAKNTELNKEPKLNGSMEVDDSEEDEDYEQDENEEEEVDEEEDEDEDDSETEEVAVPINVAVSSESEEDEDEDEEESSKSEEEDEEEEEEEDEEEKEPEEEPKKVSKKTKGIMKSKSKSKEVGKKSEKQVKFQLDKKPLHKITDLNALKQTLLKMKNNLPKTEQKFGNFAKSNFHITDEKLIKQAWSWAKQNFKL